VVLVPVRTWRKPLDADKVKPPEGEVHLIKDRCKGCGLCIEYCPKKVLEESDEINARGVHPPKVPKKRRKKRAKNDCCHIDCA